MSEASSDLRPAPCRQPTTSEWARQLFGTPQYPNGRAVHPDAFSPDRSRNTSGLRETNRPHNMQSEEHSLRKTADKWFALHTTASVGIRAGTERVVDMAPPDCSTDHAPPVVPGGTGDPELRGTDIAPGLLSLELHDIAMRARQVPNFALLSAMMTF